MFGNGIVIIKLPSVFILGTNFGGGEGGEGRATAVAYPSWVPT
jgi:hypothetical protein